jgi:DNA-3-methyladenine glycosylase II
LDDPAAIARALDELAARDADVARWRARVGDPPPRIRPRGYPTLLRALVGQQISVAAATGIHARLAAALGDVDDPARVLAATDDALRAVGLSRQKVEYARALADAVASGRLDFDELVQLDDEAAIAKIAGIRGFGRWSAEIYLMFGERRPDVFAADDLAIQEGLRRLRGMAERPRGKAARALGDAFRPHRTTACLFLWRVYADKSPL